MWHAQGGDGSGDGGLHGRHRPGDPAAPAVPDDRSGALSQRSYDARDIGCQGERVVPAGWFVGGSVAAQINGGHMIAGLGECDQLIALSQAGYHVAAIDLRGYGASDKPPRGYDTFTLAADVASIVRSLGESTAAIIGHGWGGWIAWSMPTLQPAVTRAVAALGMPHPLVLRHASVRNPAQVRANAYLAGLQRPFVPEHQMSKSPAYVERLLGAWSAPGGLWPPRDLALRYAEAMALPFVAHSAAEYYRWVVRSQWRLDGRRFAHCVRSPITV